jgi:hypothetical protein
VGGMDKECCYQKIRSRKWRRKKFLFNKQSIRFDDQGVVASPTALNPNDIHGALQHNFAEHEEKLFKLNESQGKDGNWSISQLGPNYYDVIFDEIIKDESAGIDKEGKRFYSTESAVPKRILKSDFIAYIAVRMDQNGTIYADIEDHNSHKIKHAIPDPIAQFEPELITLTEMNPYRLESFPSQSNLDNNDFTDKIDKMYDNLYNVNLKIDFLMEH